MKTPIIIPLVLVSLVATPCWGLTMDDLVEREGLFYKKFTDVPFTGVVKGKEQGRFKDGRKDGKWMEYYDSGQLWKKSFFWRAQGMHNAS